MINLILNTDSYKASHWNQYPPETEKVYAYIESRGGEFDKTVFFGLQIWLKEYLMKPITKEDIDEAETVFTTHGEPFNREGWEHILYNHKGFMPVKIKAIPEGTVVNNLNVLVTIENTDPKCWWLPSYLETQILRAVWYPSTVATISYHCKQLIQKAINKTSDIPEQIDFKLHDFGARGVSSFESAGIGGLAHLVNFKGTDTISALVYANKYYFEPSAGFSIPAAEHSTITSWGKENEPQAFENMLDLFLKPGKIVAVVSDSYDLWNAVDNLWGDRFKERIENSGGTLVVRPDSGNPMDVPIFTILKLMNKFGYTTNSKGYKVLPSYVRVIQGDGINHNSLCNILKNLETHDLAIDNLAFGMGGGLLQHCNRDTLKFAMKTSMVTVNGENREVFKDPVTDKGKISKKGRFVVYRDHSDRNKFITVNNGMGHDYEDELLTVYEDGELKKTYTLTEVRKNSIGVT